MNLEASLSPGEEIKVCSSGKAKEGLLVSLTYLGNVDTPAQDLLFGSVADPRVITSYSDDLGTALPPPTPVSLPGMGVPSSVPGKVECRNVCKR